MDLRVANMEDVPAMNALIAASARELSIGFYSPPQIEALLTHVFGVDTQLLADGTYYIVDAMEAPGDDGAVGEGPVQRQRRAGGGVHRDHGGGEPADESGGAPYAVAEPRSESRDGPDDRSDP